MNAPRQTGITLLEVLVAFSILALSLGVIMQIFASGSRAALRGEDYTQAVLIAESKLARSELLEGKPQTLSGTEAERFDWTLSVELSEHADPADADFSGRKALYRVRVTVSWGAAADERESRVVLTTLRLLKVA